MKTKRCRGKCGEEKSIEEFYTFCGAKDGLRNICIKCWADDRDKRKSAKEKRDNPSEGISCDVTDASQAITLVSKTIRSLDGVLKAANVDLSIWSVDRWVANKWDQGMKIKRDDGDSAVVNELWQVKVWLKRKIPKSVEDGLQGIIKKMQKFSPKYASVKPAKLPDPHLLEISINDAHWAKLAWAPETGDNYDLTIVQSLYSQAVENLVAKASGFNIEKILLPVGNDFFHVDGSGNMTSNGTPQDTDGRYVKMFESGQMAVVKAIDYLQRLAPVEVLWVGGNHDRLSSWHLVHTLKVWFRKCDRVTVNDGPSARKYFGYGANLIGFTHGDEEKHVSLPNIMAGEQPQMWALSKWREWHLGHFHKRKETMHVGTDTFEGVVVRVLPSISGRDAWHARKGYMGLRAADAFLFSKDNGPSGYFTANVVGESKIA